MVFWRKKKRDKNRPRLPDPMKFIFGAIAGMTSTSILQPLDLVKTRMQVDDRYYKRSLRHVIRDIYVQEGIISFYNGLSFSLFRQATATAARFGIYSYLNQQYKQVNQNLFARIIMGAASGAVGSFCGAPAELIQTRMTADGRLPFAYRYNYTGVANALIRIIGEEGVRSLWIGCVATFAKGSVLAASQLSSYVEAKNSLAYRFNMKDGLAMHFYASMVSGLVCAVASLPFDAVKTRIQIQETCGKRRYGGTVDAFSKIIRHEGVASLFRGFVPYYARLGPHSVFTLVFYEEINKFYMKRTGRGSEDFTIEEGRKRRRPK